MHTAFDGVGREKEEEDEEAESTSCLRLFLTKIFLFLGSTEGQRNEDASSPASSAEASLVLKDLREQEEDAVRYLEKLCPRPFFSKPT